MPLPRYIEEVEQQILAVSSNAAHMEQIGNQLDEFREVLDAMLRITQQSGLLVFERDDWGEASRKASELLQAFEDTHETWQGILLDPGPSSGTIEMIGRA